MTQKAIAKHKTKAVKNQLARVPQVSSLQSMVDEETQNRRILTQFIADHMKKGTDYGPIHINSKCPDKYNCDVPYHFSKNCLFKPGSEKFVSLMRLTVKFHKDTDTWEMAGSTPGLFCYIADLINPKGQVIGEGRGACSISEKGSPNTAIKIAQKRAQVDAVLRTGGLSDFFTADLEDMVEITEQPKEVKKSAEQPEDEEAPVFKRRKYMYVLLKEKGRNNEHLHNYIKEKFNLDSVKDLLYIQQEEVIKKLESLDVLTEEIVDVDDVDKQITQGRVQA